MNLLPSDWLQIVLFICLFLMLTPALGAYMAEVFSEKPFYATPLFGWLERLAYKAGGINPAEEMRWTEYGKSLLLFNLCGFVFLFILTLMQGWLPLNPHQAEGVPWHLAFNIASSFVTNTNWQSYEGESTLSYFTQMIGITSTQFLSAATGLAALLALTRGITRKNSDTIGNFWADLVRGVVYLLLPLSILLAILLVSEGVIQNFSPYIEITTLENEKQIIPMGPVASQEAIKMLGTNGGGFFAANSAHPFENPTPFSNFLEMLALLLLPAAAVYAYGVWAGSKKDAWILFSAMFALWAAGILLAFISRLTPNPVIATYPVLEGIETRLRISSSLLWTISTTATANGAVNAMLSSLSPLTEAIALFNLMIGEMFFGGIGVGLCTMIKFTLLTVFISGLMVGRTPEYLGKKIEIGEMQWVVVVILMPGALTLLGAALSSVLPIALESISTKGPHGLTEILYAFASSAVNNGSSFAGLNANTPYYNVILGVIMLMGRTSIILPTLAIAGSLARKKITPPSSGTLSTQSFLFFILLVGVILIVGALTFFPAISLGPFVEHLLMLKNQSF